MKNLAVALKGFFMGAANVVPGVSGGTIALITGIYKDIVDALNSVMEPCTWKALLKGRLREFWKCIDGTFLLWLFVGILASVFSLAKVMTWCLANCPVQTWALFFGLILASSVVMFRDVKGWGVKEIVLTIIGIILGIVVCTLSPRETPDSYWFLFLCGAIAICTMILPGISGSFMLLVLGKYDFVMEAVSHLDIPVLTVFGLGCVVGILAFSKFLHWLLGRCEKQTMLVLLGFVLGSLVKVWPWANAEAAVLDDPHYVSAGIWCMVGVIVVLAMEYFGKRVAKNKNN